MVDTICSTRKTIRLGGEDRPAEVVRSRFLKLIGEHVEYVVGKPYFPAVECAARLGYKRPLSFIIRAKNHALMNYTDSPIPKKPSCKAAFHFPTILNPTP